MKKLINLTMIMWVLMFFMMLVITSCSSDSGGNDPSAPEIEYKGKLEKGAFQKGAEIIAYGWDAVTGFNGESYATTTTDNLGNYTLKSSKIRDILYVKAEGYFYNENSNTVSDSTLKLYGIIDSTKVPWNINVLTHIIKDRVVFLLESGATYDSAVSQAMTELYANFNWTPINPGTISITNNAQLLLLSAAVCKDRTVSQISSLLTTLSTDFIDGTIDVSILDDSFYNVDTSIVEGNMLALYGITPSLGAVKTALIAFRAISGPPPKVYIISPVPSAEFYYFTIGKQLSGYIEGGEALDIITMSVTIKQDGFADIVQSFSFSDFFKIDSIIYFSAIIDGETKYMSQFAGVVSIIDVSAYPVRPVKTRIEMNNGRYSVVSGTWSIYNISDVRNITTGSGIARTSMVTGWRMVTDYYGQTGMFFVCDDLGVTMPLTSGLYFYPENRMSPEKVNSEAGEMW